MRDIFRRYTHLVEPISIDEAYLDVTEPLQGPPSATLVAELIRNDIRRELNLTVTAGVSYCKFVARLASGLKKPDALNVILETEAPDMIAALRVDRIHGIGPKTAARLHGLGIHTGADLRGMSENRLERLFGRNGLRYFELVRGIDTRAVNPDAVRKSVSTEDTFAADLETVPELELEVPPLATGLARRLQRAGIMARGVSVKVKFADHSIMTRQQLLPLPVSERVQLEAVAVQILRERFDPLPQPVRLLGLGAYDLQEMPFQVPLFPDWQPHR